MYRLIAIKKMEERRCPSCFKPVFSDPFSGNRLYACTDPTCRFIYCESCRGGGFIKVACPRCGCKEYRVLIG